MVRGLPGDREVADPIYSLNKWAALYAEQRRQDDEKPYVQPIAPKGLRVRLGITNQRKLQVLGCGFRVVSVQFRGKTVVLHHNGNTATIDRKDFKELVASNRRNRERNAAWAARHPRFAFARTKRAPSLTSPGRRSL